MKYNLCIITDGRIVNELGEELLNELNTKLKLIEDSYDHCLMYNLYSKLECNVKHLNAYKNLINEFMEKYNLSEYVLNKFKRILNDIDLKLSFLNRKEHKGILTLHVDIPMTYKTIKDDIVQIKMFDEKIISSCKYEEIESKINEFIRNISITFDTIQGSRYIHNIEQPAKIVVKRWKN